MPSDSRTPVICWRDPGKLRESTRILSFLAPRAHDALEARHPGHVASAREMSGIVRPHSRALYRDMVAALGTSLDENGQTLRQRLATLEGGSRWWFHPVSFRDCESDPAYDWLVAIETIVRFAGDADVIELHGAPAEIVAVLRSRYQLREIDSEQSASLMKAFVRSILSRVRMTIREIRHSRAAKQVVVGGTFEVALSAFWDWSVRPDGRGKLVDRYFGRLPEALNTDQTSVGFLAWLDSDTEPGKGKRSLRSVLAPLRERQDVAILQGQLRWAEIVRAYCDFAPLRMWLSSKNRRSFRAPFLRGGLDYFPLFRRQLLAGFTGASLPNCELVFRATLRAMLRHEPAMFVSFLEHFPHARAQYLAARTAGIRSSIVQHASYCHDKTFLILEPSSEFAGKPDGQSCPHGDIVFAAGDHSRDMFVESGYPPESLLTTGSPRYDHVSAAALGEKKAAMRPRILLAASLTADVEIDMVEAVAAAGENLEVDLVLRNHPFRRIDAMPRFAPFKSLISISSDTLEGDLRAADLIMFTYSTVAEEAFLAGKPVWQWVPMCFNGSALAEVWPIPQFSRIIDLRSALQTALLTGFKAPNHEERRIVAGKLFGPCDGKAADRVSQRIVREIRQRKNAVAEVAV